MANTLSEIPAAGSPGSSHYGGNTPVVNAQIRTNGAEQVQANNVERIQQEGNAIKKDRLTEQDEQARTEEIYRRRAVQAKADRRSVEEERISREQAAALVQKSVANTQPEVRGGPVASGPVNRVDVSG